jgi:hypothetical protein
VIASHIPWLAIAISMCNPGLTDDFGIAGSILQGRA